MGKQADNKEMVERTKRGPRSTPLLIERRFDPDNAAMLAALRVVLGLPRVPSPRQKEVDTKSLGNHQHTHPF